MPTFCYAVTPRSDDEINDMYAWLNNHAGRSGIKWKIREYKLQVGRIIPVIGFVHEVDSIFFKMVWA